MSDDMMTKYPTAGPGSSERLSFNFGRALNLDELIDGLTELRREHANDPGIHQPVWISVEGDPFSIHDITIGMLDEGGDSDTKHVILWTNEEEFDG